LRASAASHNLELHELPSDYDPEEAMAEYSASIEWERNGAVFTDNRYDRRHAWRFDGGVEVRASSSPHAVPVPLSDATAVDPEEAFVASIASCHMLWFLSIAAKRGFVVDSYRDDPIGQMGRNDQGKPAMTVVTLRPAVSFGASRVPAWPELLAMHHEAHDECYIANSVRSDVRCEPVAVNAHAPAR
jgi:organic hydroperoxide reductase OsmC/OhrA